MNPVRTLPESGSLMTAGEIEGLPRHDDLWFDDGNVVIATSDLSFRLHRGVLTRHSDVFKDMFQLPQSTQGTVEGSPVVQVHDRGADLVRLFTLLYDGIKDPIARSTEAIEFKTLRALLRLAYKYEIPHLQSEMSDRLATRFPSVMKEWDDKDAAARVVKTEPRDAIAVVNLARLYDLSGILPVALFECCQLPKADLLATVEYDEGDVERLSMADLQLCLSALDVLAEQSRWVRKVLLNEGLWATAPCDTMNECYQARHSLVEKLMFDSHDASIHTTNPLVRLTPRMHYWAEDVHGPCEVCCDVYTPLEDSLRLTAWMNLGKTFGLPSWVGSFTRK